MNYLWMWKPADCGSEQWLFVAIVKMPCITLFYCITLNELLSLNNVSRPFSQVTLHTNVLMD